MALSFKRDAAAAPAEALVFFEGFADVEPLAEDLDEEFGPDQWIEAATGDVDRAIQSVRGTTDLALVTIGTDDPATIDATARLIRKAREAGLMVLLVVGEVSSRSMHLLMREGVADFAPYPEPREALREAIQRLRLARSSGKNTALVAHGGAQRKGRVIGVYGVAGGVGASTLCVNLAWELCNLVRRDGHRVALLDFNFQYGSIATFLDVPRREAVYELVSEASALDQTSFAQALSTYQDRMHVLTAPRESLPLDIVSPSDISTIIALARESFDYVVIDMPQALMNWSEQVYTSADAFLAVMETDMRSAQNMFRFLRTLKSEGMTLQRLRFLLNRAPGMTELSAKARVRRVAESLGIEFAHQLPDGGRQVAAACDQGVPLSEAAKGNPLRKEIAKYAQRLLDEEQKEAQAVDREAKAG
ncbi:MAG TPA: AAA family ATPase [Thermohalobaculum sp.]|nr:AAA family ATPase [Thermohalobaculum sp.]